MLLERKRALTFERGPPHFLGPRDSSQKLRGQVPTGRDRTSFWASQESGGRQGGKQSLTGPHREPRGRVTRGEVLQHAGRRRVEDDVRAVIQVMQVVATVEPPVAKHVVESQLLHSHTQTTAALRGSRGRATGPRSGSSQSLTSWEPRGWLDSQLWLLV